MSDFDGEELFHLGLKASEDGDKERSISFFKRSVELEPTAAGFYLLGAEYAEIGMMARAAEHMQRAVDADPELWTAWFQLGLVYLALQDTDRATASFQPLLGLGEEEYLYQFARGMNLLISEEVEPCIAALNQGLSLNDDNPALNRDVQNIIDNLMETFGDVSQSGGITAPAEPADHGTDSKTQSVPEHLLVSKYRDT